jgi:uncharacterized membrane protein
MVLFRSSWTDEQVEQLVGNLLRTGVILAAVVVLIGGILYLARYGANPPSYSAFKGEPEELRSVPAIVAGAVDLRRRALIQLGLLLLIATPIARVALSVFAFFRQRDWTYVAVTLFVLAVLLYGLFGEHP